MGSKTICKPDTQGRDIVQKISFVDLDRRLSEQNNAKPNYFFDNEIFYGLSWSPHAMKLLANGHSMKL